MIGIVFEHLPNLVDGRVDAVFRIHKDSITPKRGDDLLTCDELAFPLGEKDQQLHRSFLQPKHTVAAPQLVTAEIEDKFLGL